MRRPYSLFRSPAEAAALLGGCLALVACTTPLMRAVKAGDTASAGLLLAQGVDVNQQHNSTTPLMRAAQRGDVAMVNLLLEHGADLNLKTDADETALMAAACGLDQCKTYTASHREVALSLIVAGADVNGQTRTTRKTALTMAAFHGDRTLVRALLERGAEVNPMEDTGASALWIAADWGHPDVVGLLAENGADVNVIPNPPHDFSALYVASELGFSGVGRTLLAHSADTSLSDRWGNTPPMMAAANGHAEIVQLLTEAGANVNARSQAGRTALHYAAFQGLDKIVKLLFAHGADATVRCKLYETAEMVAARVGHAETAEILKKAQRQNQRSGVKP